MVRWLVVGGAIVAVFACATACALFSGPTTKDEVCAEFDELGDRFLEANGVVDNLLFIQAGTLADVADRYGGSPDLSADAAALGEISDADTTTGYELMAATDDIAAMCGHVLGERRVVADGGGDWWDTEDPTEETGQPAPTHTDPPPTTTGETPSTEDDLRTVTGPHGISLRIPASWTVGGSPAAANQQASDPADPSVFLRFGAADAPDVPLPTEIQNGETGNPNVRNGYRRVQLVELTFLGQPAVDWEFTFVKDGVTRHAFGRYWRQDGLTYVIYLSAPADRWVYVDWVFQIMSDSVSVN